MPKACVRSQYFMMVRSSFTADGSSRSLLAIPVLSRRKCAFPFNYAAQGNQQGLNGLSPPIHHGGPLPGAFVVQGASLNGNPIQSSVFVIKRRHFELSLSLSLSFWAKSFFIR